jgi:anhydro-N-acetylmuramic acid kinase
VRAIGLMSGTSLDGIDAALIDVVPRDDNYDVKLRRFATVAFDPALLEDLRGALPPGAPSIESVTLLNRRLGLAFAEAAASVAEDTIDFAASHGHTVWHDGERGLTAQIGDPYAIRDRLGATVCFDFRTADCVAGGHGAPLVPHIDALLFSDPAEDRLAINIGGIANLTALPRGKAGAAYAYDTGPGNMLLDAFVRSRSNGAATMDRDGALAAHGEVDRTLLAAMLQEAYFTQPFPKSTGRERFGEQYLAQHGEGLRGLSDADGAATLTELTARTVAQAIVATGFSAPRAILSGGGARNTFLLQRLAHYAPHAQIEASDRYGVPVDAKEAIAFAILGYETLRGRAANVPAATGAKRPTVLGAIVPHELSNLLERLERECRST